MAQEFPIRLDVQVPGAKNLSVMLSRYSGSISDFTPFWNDYFLPAWYSLLGQQYASQGAFTGEPWAPLSAAYQAWKTKHYPGATIGIRTGDTMRSLVNLGGSNSVLQVSKDALIVGSGVRYAMYLQMGTRRMPARPPLRVNKLFMTEVGKQLQRFAYDMSKKVKV